MCVWSKSSVNPSLSWGETSGLCFNPPSHLTLWAVQPSSPAFYTSRYHLLSSSSVSFLVKLPLLANSSPLPPKYPSTLLKWKFGSHWSSAQENLNNVSSLYPEKGNVPDWPRGSQSCDPSYTPVPPSLSLPLMFYHEDILLFPERAIHFLRPLLLLFPQWNTIVSISVSTTQNSSYVY